MMNKRSSANYTINEPISHSVFALEASKLRLVSLNLRENPIQLRTNPSATFDPTTSDSTTNHELVIEVELNLDFFVAISVSEAVAVDN
jgi:hypothetical protein